MAKYREATPEQAAFLTSLFEAGVLMDTGAAGLSGQGPAFVDVRDAFTNAVSRASGGGPGRVDAVSAVDLDVRDREERLSRILPPSRRPRLLLRRERRPGARARGARGRPRGLERVRDGDRCGPPAGGLLSGLPTGRQARPTPARRRDRRHGQRLGLPQRAVGDPARMQIVPHARVRPDRRSSRRRGVPRRVAGADAGALRPARPRRGIGDRVGPVLRSRRPDAGREPAASRS